MSPRIARRIVRGVWDCFIVCIVSVTAVGGAAGSAAAQEIQRRWDKPETPYAEMALPEKVGTNVRRGVVGLVDSLGQGLFSTVAVLSPYGGYAVRKVATLGGDVVGLVDDNPVTTHALRGVLSRHLLRLGAGGQGLPSGLALIHDTTFDVPALQTEDYVGDRTFHTEAYIHHSVLASVGGIVLSNVLIRPVGSLITIFGARETGDAMNEFGLDLIEESLRIRFL